MPSTRDFDETITARAQRDPEFRETLLRPAAEALLRGQTDRGLDLAIVSRRLADTRLSDYIPLAQIEAEIRKQEA